MTALKEQLESLSAQHVEGIVLSHPGEPHVSIPDGPAASIIDLSEERQRRRGRYILTAVAAAVVLVGFLIFTNSGDDNSAPSPVATEGELDGPIVGPNGEDLGIWSDAILALGPQDTASQARKFEQSRAASWSEVSECLLEVMEGDPPSAPSGDPDALLVSGSRAFAESEGFGYGSWFEFLYSYPDDVNTCYFARTVDGLYSPDDTEAKVATNVLLLSDALATVVMDEPRLALAGPIEVLIGLDPAIVATASTWSTCMSEKGFEFDSELQARSISADRWFGLDADTFDGDEVAALKAEEAAIATAAWECSGGDEGSILREKARRRALADLVIANRAGLDFELDLALNIACEGASQLAADEAADIQERGEARLQNLGCE